MPPRDNPFKDLDARASVPDMTPATENPAVTEAAAIIADATQDYAPALRAVLRMLESQVEAQRRGNERLDTLDKRLQAVAESIAVLTRTVEVVRAVASEVRTQTVPPSLGNSKPPVDFNALEVAYRAALAAHNVPVVNGRPDFGQVKDVGTFYRIMSSDPDPRAAYTTVQSAIQGPAVTRPYADLRRLWAHIATRSGNKVAARRFALDWLASPPCNATMPYTSRYQVIRAGLSEAGALFTLLPDAVKESDAANGTDSAAKLRAVLSEARAAFPKDPGHMATYL